MNEQNNENGNIEQDVFAEVLKTAFAALYGDTATRRLAAGDIVHALASAYPGVGAAKDAHGDAPARSEEPTGWDRFLTVAPGVKLVRFKGDGFTQLVSDRRGVAGTPNVFFEIFVKHATRSALVKKNGELIFSVCGFCTNQGNVERMAVSALRRYLSICAQRNARSHSRRKNKAARAAGCPF